MVSSKDSRIKGIEIKSNNKEIKSNINFPSSDAKDDWNLTEGGP
ncbi:hypothetical protein [Paenibacillus sp. TSA_86.1]